MNIFKYHALGNDFIILDFNKSYDLKSLSIRLCNRKTGVGADGLIAVKKNPLEMVFYNQDGSIAPMCGNGIRAFAKYVVDHELSDSLQFDVTTLAGIMKIKVVSTNPFECIVDMGKPLFDCSLLHIDSHLNPMKLQYKGQNIYSVFMGTIHTVLFCEDPTKEIASSLGREICFLDLFKEKTNVNFVKIINRNEIMVRTFERGVGPTLACGTGCCASVVIGNKLNLLDPLVTVHLELGDLKISYQNNCFMQGPATFVFETKLED